MRMLNPQLLLWIILGLFINFYLLKNDAELKKEHWFGLGFIVILRSISGGIISNYLFSAGIMGMDLSSMTLLGILPAAFLLINKYFNKQLV
jgi:uncharacterized membrane-anchored protein YitT (DUF2179 family)